MSQPSRQCRGSASVSEASKLFRRWMRCRCGGSRTDSGMLTLTCAGSARVPAPRWSRGFLHRRQGVPGSAGTRNKRRLTR